MKKINSKKVPCSKKKRIQNKYIPKGIYCYDKNGRCPFWLCREATDKELEIIYNKEIKLFGYFETEDGKKIDNLKEAIHYMKTGKEKDYFMEVYECKLINYIELSREGLLWDECKECGRRDSFYSGLDYRFPISNKERRKTKK